MNSSTANHTGYTCRHASYTTSHQAHTLLSAHWQTYPIWPASTRGYVNSQGHPSLGGGHLLETKDIVLWCSMCNFAWRQTMLSDNEKRLARKLCLLIGSFHFNSLIYPSHSLIDILESIILNLLIHALNAPASHFNLNVLADFNITNFAVTYFFSR